MTVDQLRELDPVIDSIALDLDCRDLRSVASRVHTLSTEQIVAVAERLAARERAVMYRLLPKQRALEVFEALAPELQADLVHGLREPQVAALFAELDPDDRVWLLDELPATVAPRLLRGLPARDRARTATMLGYRPGCIGRRMSPEAVTVRTGGTVAQAMVRVRARLGDAETVYTLVVLDGSRRVVGVVSLRELLGAGDETVISALMRPASTARADEDAARAARRCADRGLLAMPVVDNERRLVGVLTIDDAVRILKREDSQDVARQGGAEPLTRPYLGTPIRAIVRSRVVWLLVLAVGATLTVQVLSVFEATLEQVTVLALFVPLLIGTGGNTGNQAATTVTRALALGDVGPRDLLRVLGRELRVGCSLGLLLGALGFAIAGTVYDPSIGLVIALTLLAVCTVAATIGGMMPLVARAVRVDPAVFSNPFISTFVDATGLIIYFLIARSVLGI